MLSRIISVHHTRFAARKQERAITKALEDRERILQEQDRQGNKPAKGAQEDIVLSTGNPLDPKGWIYWPTWAKGVRVEKAGLLQYAVVATEKKGH